MIDVNAVANIAICSRSSLENFIRHSRHFFVVVSHLPISFKEIVEIVFEPTLASQLILKEISEEFLRVLGGCKISAV